MKSRDEAPSASKEAPLRLTPLLFPGISIPAKSHIVGIISNPFITNVFLSTMPGVITPFHFIISGTLTDSS